MEAQGTSLAPVDLPEDIVRLLFETMAGVRCDDLACVSTRVSKQVKLWVEPILYRDVIVDEQGLFHRTVTAAESTKPPDFFATHIKALLFNLWRLEGHRRCEIPQIIERCTSVRSLAFWVPCLMRSANLQALLASGALAPTQISLVGYVLDVGMLTFSHPIFRNATRVEIMWGSDAKWDWSTLGSLTRLTHLNFGLHCRVDALTPVVTETLRNAPPSLRVLVIAPAYPSLLDGKEILAINKGEVDARVVVASANPSHESFAMSEAQAEDEWGHPSTTHTTAWSLAEDMIQMRNKKRTNVA